MNFVHPSDGIFKVPFYQTTWIWFSNGEIIGTFRSKPRPQDLRSGVVRPQPLTDSISKQRILSCMTLGLEEKPWEQLDYGNNRFKMIERNPKTLEICSSKKNEIAPELIDKPEESKSGSGFGLAVLASFATAVGAEILKRKTAKKKEVVLEKVEEKIEMPA